MTVDIGFVRGKTYFMSMPHPHRSVGSLTQTLIYLDEVEYVKGCPRSVFRIMLDGRFAGEFCIDPERACQMIHTRPDAPHRASQLAMTS